MPPKIGSRTKKPRVSETVEIGRDRVTVVTEVVEDAVGGETEPREVPVKKEEPEAPVVEADTASGGTDEQTEDRDLRDSEESKDEESAEKQKHVVEELFKPATHSEIPEITMGKQQSKPIIFWALGVVVIALVVGGGLVMFTRGSFSLPSFSLSAPTPTATLPPSPPTPTPLDKELITIQVLNGSGTPGAAGTMQTFLEEKGYTVSDTGNAEEYLFEETEIHVKPSKEAYLAVLEDELSQSYTVGTLKATLSEDETYDVRIIVGK
jgi:hypothetical protein